MSPAVGQVAGSGTPNLEVLDGGARNSGQSVSMHDEILTVAELALFLKCSKPKIYQMALKGEIPSRRLGVKKIGTKPQYRFIKSEVLEHLRSNHKLTSIHLRPIICHSGEVGKGMQMLNPQPLEQEPSNLIILKAAPNKATQKKDKRTYKGRKLPKGITLIGGTFYINFQRDGERIRVSAETDSLTVAVDLLQRRRYEAVHGFQVLENLKPEKEIEKYFFKDLALAAIRKRAANSWGQITFEEAKIFIGEGSDSLEAKKKIKHELKIVENSGEKPRFNYNAVNSFCENLQKILKYFGEMELPIDPDSLDDYVAMRKEQGREGNTIRNELLTLSSVHRWGLKDKKFRNLGIHNPYDKDLHKQTRGDAIYRYCTWEERAKYLDACDSAEISFPRQLFRDVSEFAPLIGLRIENIFKLRAGQFNLEKGTFGWILFNGWKLKGKRLIDQPIVYKRAREIILKYIEGKSGNDLLFHYPVYRERISGGYEIIYSTFKKAFNKVVKTAEIKGMTPHSWKKTFGMELGIRGDSEKDIQLLMQHMDWKTTTDNYYDEVLVREERQKRLLLPIKVQNRLRGGFTPAQSVKKVSKEADTEKREIEKPL